MATPDSSQASSPSAVTKATTAAHGIPFIHLELAPALRSDPKLIARVAATVAAGL